jgi:hypothetical protein
LNYFLFLIDFFNTLIINCLYRNKKKSTNNDSSLLALVISH